MFKKLLSILLTAFILFSGYTYADSTEDNKNHWLFENINEQFAKVMFPDILNSSTKIALLDKSISVKEFNTIMNNFCIRNNIETTFTVEEASIEGLLRKDAFKTISNLIKTETCDVTLPFSDIENIEQDYISAIKKLYSLKIIKGVSNDLVKPNEQITLAQSIMLLQNFNDLLEVNMKKISYKIISRENLGNSTEGISTKEKDDKIILTIIKAFPNPGYNMDIKNIIEKENGEYLINMKIISPERNKLYSQVITYRKINIEIDMHILKNQYKFKLNLPNVLNPIKNKY
ncbi:S-layer homology domain-containing protein [Abyssisolibacter fermentans]|uniref:S-layer homology domain-containing protein n=1 Tax=Abyssisolibacter fermentans TaxID=1766203 RepID=UPI000836A5A1|nr:S-layer homology domain-containing protein [Abyssisolibacter fermentans]